MRYPPDPSLVQRLVRYVESDERGIRRAILDCLSQNDGNTVQEVHTHLMLLGHDVSRQSVGSMMGMMGSRLGILRVYMSDGQRIYKVKEEYAASLKQALDNL